MAGPSPPRRRWWVLGLAAVVVAAAAGGWLAAGAGDGPPGETSVDVGFLRDMADHHDQAVQLATFLLGAGADPVLRGFATDTIATQRYELGLMDARLQDWGHGRGAVGRDTMAWMGMPTPLAEMAGMASAADLQRLSRAEGVDAELLFIDLMTAHHEGALHMADHAWEHAETEQVRDLAERIAKLQRLEIRDLALMRERLAG